MNWMSRSDVFICFHHLVIECRVRAIELDNSIFLFGSHESHTQIAGRIRTDNDRVAQYAGAAWIRNGSFQE